MMELKGIKVLIAEDNDTIREVLSQYLEVFDLDVTQARDGREALSVCSSKKFDIIITDLKMPHLSGLDFLKNLPPFNQHAVKILMSGEASVEDVVTGFHHKIDDFLIKPIPTPEMVHQMIKRQVKKLRLQEDLHYKNTLIKSYNEILSYLNDRHDTASLFTFLYQHLKELIPLSRMELLLLDKNKEHIFVKYIHSAEKSNLVEPGTTVPTQKSYFLKFITEASSSYSHPEVLQLKQIPSPSKYDLISKAIEEGMNSALLFPLKVSQKVYGLLNFYSNKNDAYHSYHLENLSGIAHNISVSFERSLFHGRLLDENSFLKSSLQNLTSQLLDQQDSLIFSLAELTEQKDKSMGEHLLRMQNFARILAQDYLGQDDTVDIGYGAMTSAYAVELIFKSSPLHDIGKVGIPDKILFKPGQLSHEEFEIMKSHTLIGSDCLKKAADKVHRSDFLLIGKDIAHYHHEKWNGEGYPENRKGKEIPISARIVALADVYDALRSPRTYKPSWSHEETCQYIADQKEKHFDPDLVDIFLKKEKYFNEMYNNYSLLEQVPEDHSRRL